MQLPSGILPGTLQALILVTLPSCPRGSSLVLGWGAPRKARTLQGVRSSEVAWFPICQDHGPGKQGLKRGGGKWCHLFH